MIAYKQILHYSFLPTDLPFQSQYLAVIYLADGEPYNKANSRMQSISLVPVLKNSEYLLDKYKLLLWIIQIRIWNFDHPYQKAEKTPSAPTFEFFSGLCTLCHSSISDNWATAHITTATVNSSGKTPSLGPFSYCK